MGKCELGYPAFCAFDERHVTRFKSVAMLTHGKMTSVREVEASLMPRE